MNSEQLEQVPTALNAKLSNQDYTEIKTIKRTKFIHTKLCIHNITQIKYIHKCIDIEYWKQCKYPFQILLNNPHSNMLQIYDYYNSDKEIILVLDYCAGGDLLEYIHKNGAYSNNQTRKIFTQIINAIQHIHSLKCTHREIKADDILLTDNTSNYIKVCDTIFNTTNNMTLYQSPQLRNVNNDDIEMNTNYNEIIENDIWSLGMLLYLMLIGSLPSTQYDLIIEMIQNKSLKWYDANIADSAKDLIYKMLQMDGCKRLKIKQIKKHSFMLGYDDIIYNQNSNNNEEQKEEQKYTLKQKILYALRSSKLRPIPSQKEMQESFAFFEKVEKYFKTYDVCIDVCGSHGLVSYLFALYCRTPFIYIIDSHKPKSFDIMGEILNIRKDTIKYIEEDLYDGLPEILQFWTTENIENIEKKKIVIIACHACAHLSDSIMDICYKYDMTEFALMPCCHARTDHYHQIGTIVDTLNGDLYNRTNIDKVINAGIVKDLIMFGRGIQMGYSMRWKMIESKITPQNRILFGLKPKEKEKKIQKKIIDIRKRKMEQNYHKNDI